MLGCGVWQLEGLVFWLWCLLSGNSEVPEAEPEVKTREFRV